MTLDAAATLPATRLRTLIGSCLVLFAVAAFELWDGLGDFHLLSDPTIRATRSGSSGLMLGTFMAVHPLFAGAALLCAATSRWRGAVMAIATLVLLRWLIELPDISAHQIVNLFSALETTAHTVAAPLLAGGAIALAIGGRRPALATVFACFLTLYNVAGIIIFIIGVSRYGF